MLYFPIYLAINLFGYKWNRTVSVQDGQTEDERVWQFDDLRIILMPQAAGGDEEAIASLQEGTTDSDEIRIAIADPMLAITKNKVHRPDNPIYLKVVATFINRIALWPIMRTPKNSSKSTQSDLIREFIDCCQHDAPLRRDFQRFQDLRVGLCDKGFTTRYLVKYFLSPAKQIEISDFGQSEIDSIIDNKSDIVFTNTPWLRKQRDSAKDIRTIRYFPPIPFPFSSVITTLGATKAEAAMANGTKPLKEFIECLYAAVLLSYRHPKSVIVNLKATRQQFRNFGLPSNHKIDDIIADAVREIISTDCLSEELRNSWTYWDFAFEAYNNKFGSMHFAANRSDWARIEHSTFLDAMWKDETFLGPRMKELMGAFIKGVKEEKFHDVQ